MRTPSDSFRVATLLLTLSLVYAVAQVNAASPHQERSPPDPLESRVTLGRDGFVSSRGAGRRRSDGLSITRSHTVDTDSVLDAIVDDQAIKFTPARVDLGRVETCLPSTQDVRVENRGRVSVRLDEAKFSHEGFSLANDVRGIRLDPGDHFNVHFVYVPSKEDTKGLDAQLRLSTTSGVFSLPIISPQIVQNRFDVSAIHALVSHGVRYMESLEFTNPLDSTIRLTEMYTLDGLIHLELSNGSVWIRPRWPREGDRKELPEVPGEYDSEQDYKRRSHRGCWDMPPGTTSPLIKVSMPKSTPAGVYRTYIHVFAGNERLLIVPVHITVLTPGIHVIPGNLDLGMLLDLPNGKEHEASLKLYNAGVNYIEIVELLVLENNFIVAAQLWGESSVIPPQSEANSTLTVRIRLDTKITGLRLGSVMLRTNATSDEPGQQILLVYGHVVHGGMAFHLNETQFGVVMPIENVVRDVDVAEVTEKSDERVAGDPEMAVTKLVTSIDGVGSTAVMAGTTAIQKLQFWNLFDSPVEVQHVWVESTLPEHDEISVYNFTQGEVPAGSYWPDIFLKITPLLQRVNDLLVVRSYSLMADTNVSRHRIQLSVYYGFLHANSTRGLQKYSISGYTNCPDSVDVSSSCVGVPKGGLVTRVLPRIDGGNRVTDTQAVQTCWSLIFDLGRVTSHHSLTEVVTLTNENPVSITLNVSSVSSGDIFGVSIRATVSRNDLDATARRRLSDDYNKINNNSPEDDITVVAGDHFELQPGFQVEFYVQVLAIERFGELTAPIMTVETSMEAFHIYARLRSVQGTFKPVTPVIVLPSMLPVHSKEIQIQYHNTFEHAVTPSKALVSSPNWKVLSIKNSIAPNCVENVIDVRFSPMENSRCLDALFLADCFIPLPISVYEQTFKQLSEYGEFVTHYDLKALKRRNARWGRLRDSKIHMAVETLVHLQTDIIEDVAEVTIKALLERPLVTTLASASLQTNSNSSNVLEFEMTELHERRQMYVNVRNPSNYSIRMELAIAETDRHWFYSCNSDTEGNENGDIDDKFGEIPPLCLAEWKEKIDNAVALEWISHDTSNIPPFYFRKRTVQVPAGMNAQLGPIYYFPSRVQEVATTVYVRNRLSHIEAVPIQARSGKGTLAVSVDSIVGPGAPSFKPTERSGESDDDEMAKLDALFGNQGLLSFDLSEDAALTDYTQSADILLSNTGAFGLAIRSVDVDDLDNFSKLLSSEPLEAVSPTKDFVVSLEDFTLKIGEGSRIILPADTTARFRVSFRPSCFASNVKSWFIVISSDSIKLIRLHGNITTGAAFSCLRSRMPLLWLTFTYWAWIIATVVTVVTTLFVNLSMAYDAWTYKAIHRVQLFNVDTSTNHGTAVRDLTQDMHLLDLKKKKPTPQTLDVINCRLEKIKLTAFAPSACVVTPAVSKLLEQRQKGLDLSELTCLPCGDGAGVTVAAPLVTEAKTNKSKSGIKLAVGKGSVSPTATEVSARDIQGHAAKDAELEAKELFDFAPRTITEVLKASDRDNSDAILCDSSDKVSSESSDKELSNSSSKSSEVFHRSASSFPLNVVNSEESGLDAVLSQWSFHSLGNERKVDRAPIPPPIDTSLSKKREEPFEAFESLSTRWRSKDWQKPSPSENYPDWSTSVSFHALGSDLLGSPVGDAQHIAIDRSNGCRESSTGLEATPRRYGDAFAAFAPLAGSLSTGMTPNAALKKAPPGFTAADAKPLETQAAFGWLQNSCEPAPPRPALNSSFGNDSAFASKLPLFGPPLPSTRNECVTLSNVGQIGSGRSKGLRGLDTPTTE